MKRFHFLILTASWSLGCGSDDALVLSDLSAAGTSAGGGSSMGGGAGAPGEASGGSGASAGAGGETGPASEVISVEEGDFQVGDVPPQVDAGVSSLPAIVSLTAPSAVTNGGSALLHVQLASPIDAPLFLVSLVGDTGYHTVAGVDADGDGIYDINVLVDGDATQPSLVLRVAVTDGMGNVGQYSEVVLELVRSGMGDVKVTLSFDRTHDLDLHVVEPSGEETSYLNDESATGGKLDLDSGGNCEPSPSNSENIFWPPGGAPPGQYRVTVHNFEHCMPGEIVFDVRVAYDAIVQNYRSSFVDGTQGNVFEVVTFVR